MESMSEYSKMSRIRQSFSHRSDKLLRRVHHGKAVFIAMHDNFSKILQDNKMVRSRSSLSSLVISNLSKRGKKSGNF